MRHKTLLLLLRDLEHVADEQICVVTVISLRTRGEWTGEHPAIFIAAEKARRHTCTRKNRLWVCDPALRPIRTQAILRQEEVGRRSNLIVRWITGRMTF